jgi:hypothetical protein
MSENKKYTQKETENFLQYAKRLIEKRKSGEYDIDKAEVYELLTGEQVGGDHARKVLCFLEKILDKVETDNINMSEGELLEALKHEKREVYKERQKFRDEKTEYKAWLREDSRVELFYERIDEAIDKLLKRKQRKIQQIKTVREFDNEKDLVVLFADAHYDCEFVVKGFNNEILNEYNRDEFERRMWKLRDEIIAFADLHQIKNLHIFDLGDIMEGLLRVGSLKSVKNSPMESVLDYTDFIYDWLESLLENGFNINFYTSLGNHSELRLFQGEVRENLECIYNRFLRKLFEAVENVKVHNNLEGMNYTDIQGFGVFSTHGQNESNISNSIKEYEDLYGITIHYIVSGHKHTKNEQEIALNKESIQARSVMGLNPYSALKLKKASKAGATMFTIHKGYGKKFTNDVKFR